MKNRFSWLGVYLLLALILLLEVIEMPQFSDGQKMSEALVWNRLIESIPASYVVWDDGGTYRAECLLKDGTDYSGTDMGVVLQSAIDALPNYYSGTILIKAGLYIAKTKVTIPNDSHLKIIGEGMHNTIIRWDTSETWSEYVGAITYDSTYFIQDEPFTLVGHQLSGLGLSAILEIEDLTLWINDSQLNGICIRGLARFTMKNVRIKGYYTTTSPPDTPSTTGLYMYTTCNDMYEFDNLVISGFCRGVFHKADHTLYNVLEVGNCKNCFQLYDGYGVVLIRPHVYKFVSTGYGFNRHTTTTATLIEPRAEGSDAGSAFWVSDTGEGDFLVDVYGATKGAVLHFLMGVSGYLRFHGRGFQNSGTAEASNGDTISFGVTFAEAPQTVLITVNENDARYIAQAYSITTTGFSLYLWDNTAGTLETVDKTISWSADYQPTAGV